MLLTQGSRFPRLPKCTGASPKPMAAVLSARVTRRFHLTEDGKRNGTCRKRRNSAVTKFAAHGFAALVCESPFKDNPAIGRMSVVWRADVTSIDGQTLVGGNLATLFPTETRLGVRANEQVVEPSGVKIEIDALDPKDQKINGVLVRADLFHVTTKTVKEQIAPFVYRYRNNDLLRKVASQESKTPAELIFPTRETGRYVVAVSAPKIKPPLVSDETTVTGEKPAEF